MKNLLSHLLWVLTLGSVVSVAQAGDEFSDFSSGPMPGIVQDEYQKMQRQLQQELSISQARIKALQAEKEAARARALDAARSDETGIKLMNDFDALLKTRYIDKKGKFQPGLELSKDDVQHLNGLFQEHLAMLPLAGRVSAGQAHKQIAWGADYLEDQRKAHKDPTESNNSEFEIIGKLMRDENSRSEKANMLADTLGLKLNPNLPATVDQVPGWTKADALPQAPDTPSRRTIAAKKNARSSDQ